MTFEQDEKMISDVYNVIIDLYNKQTPFENNTHFILMEAEQMLKSIFSTLLN